MKKTMVIVMACAIQCLITCITINAQTEPQSKFHELKFEVKPFKDKYLPLEPIVVSYKIYNPTSRTIAIWGKRSNILCSLEINKDSNKILPQMCESSVRHGVTYVESKQIIEGKGVLDIGLSNVFPNYGKYELTFTIYNFEVGKESRSMSVSAKGEITIQEAMDINAEALDFIYKTHQIPIHRIFSRWDDKREDKTKDPLKEFVEKYGESVYGDYAVFELGNFYKRLEKYDLAKKELNKLKDKKDFGYFEEVKSNLSEIERVETNRRFEKPNN